MTVLQDDRMPGPAVIDGIDVDAVAAAVAGCPGVAALEVDEVHIVVADLATDITPPPRVR